MEPNIDDLRALMQNEAPASEDATASLGKFVKRAGDEGRALELAVSAIEALREKGSLTGAELCRLALLHGYDEADVARAWKTRTEFDLNKKVYALDAPIARVLPLL